MNLDDKTNEDLLDYVLVGEWTQLTYGDHQGLYARGLICNDGARVVVLSEIEEEVNDDGEESDSVTVRDVIPFEDFEKKYQGISIEWAGIIH